MDTKLKIQIAGIALILLIFLIGNQVSTSAQQQSVIYISGFGFLALLTVMSVLAISLIARFIKNGITLQLLANRRWIGIYSFVFALIHVMLVAHFFFNWNIGKMLENPNRVLGAAAFIILAAMAATSNDASVSALGKYWKWLQYLVYVALGLILVHSFNIGMLFLKNVYVQAFILLAAVAVTIVKAGYNLAATKRPLF